jgi:hypothetical protein
MNGSIIGYIMAYNLMQEKTLFSGPVNKAKIIDLKITNDEKRIISASEDGSISIINVDESL